MRDVKVISENIKNYHYVGRNKKNSCLPSVRARVNVDIYPNVSNTSPTDKTNTTSPK